MIPKVYMRRSWLYDKALKREPELSTPPSDAVFKKKIAGYRKIWQREGKKILHEIARVTKLKWTQQEIICYITWGVRPYSDPLTLNIRRNARDTLDTLTHELIHRILSQYSNPKRFLKNWEKIMERYKEHVQVTKTHIVVHAIHEHILRKFYGEARTNHEINNTKNPDYIVAWDVVKKDGYKNIITDLTKGLT